MAGLTVSSVTGPSKRVREDVVSIENSRALLIPINLLINNFVVEYYRYVRCSFLHYYKPEKSSVHSNRIKAFSWNVRTVQDKGLNNARDEECVNFFL